MELNGKTVLITGGAAGIGLESAKQFLANGATVIITGRTQARLDAAKKQFPALTALNSDVASAADAQLLFERIKGLGGIDILYNNAGVLSAPLNLGMPTEKHLEAATYIMNVNYFGAIRLINLFMDMLKSRREGAIINTTSILSYVPSMLGPTYSASKAALRFYTESLRKHLQILNSSVKVFELLPPLVATEMAAGFDQKAMPTEELVKILIAGLKKDEYTIRAGNTKKLYLLNRLFPKKAFELMNDNRHARWIQG